MLRFLLFTAKFVVIQIRQDRIVDMSNSPSHIVTGYLQAWQSGDKAALDEMIPLVHGELIRIARRSLGHEQNNLPLQTVELVNEAYLKLVDHQNVDWQGRAHFYGICARLMRQILIDYARHRNAEKRGGGAVQVTLDDALIARGSNVIDILSVDEALRRLAELDERKCRIAELRFFCGLSVEESAAVLGVSTITIKRDWRMTKAWLHRELK